MREISLVQEILSYHNSGSTAVIDGSNAVSYRELDSRTEILAEYLISACGMQKGTRVTILMRNSWKFVASLFAVIRGGGIAVPVDFRSSLPEYEYILRNTGAGIQIVEDERKGFVESLSTLAKVVDPSSGMHKKLEGSIFPQAEPDDPAIIFYTGGTTGFPKGVPLTHRNILHIVKSLSSAWSLVEGSEKFVQFLPMTHSGGFNCSMNTCLYAGGTAVMMEKFTPEGLLDSIERHQATVVVGVPTVYSSLVKNTDLSSRNLSTVKVFFSSGAKMPENVAGAFFQKTGKHINVGWGLTEASPQLTVSPMGLFRDNYVGKPLPGTEVVSVDEEGRVLPEGEVGNLAARGPQVMSGYWRNEETNLKVFTGSGHLLTGDLGYVGEDGIYLMGRSKDVIISGGYKIWRSEVENTLLEHQCVRETAVIGISDPLYGETVKAYIVPRCDITGEEITAFCRSRISAYKVPRIIEFREELPKSSLGKILHRKLEREKTGQQQ